MPLPTVRVLIIDEDGFRSASLQDGVAMTLIAVASEDPESWQEVSLLWPRYSTSKVPEFVSALPIEMAEREQAMRDVRDTEDWVVLDLVLKRYLSGRAREPIGRDACFAMHVDEAGNQHEPLSVHFGPWWELHERVDSQLIDQPRATPICVPYIDREFLFGEPLLLGLAQRILKLARTERGRVAMASNKRNSLYPLTVEVHRDWLMTPHEAIDGRFPRQLLHGGGDWIGKLTWAQRLRFERGIGKLVAVPPEVTAYRSGPMGREEMAIYFDLCRELIDSAWHWCEQELKSTEADCSSDTLSQAVAANGETAAAPASRQLLEERISNSQRLVEYLRAVKSEWLAAPFEGSAPPAFIIECSRRRVPRGSGVEIVGMADREPREHIIDCDCPICLAMADGLFGVGFTSIDGHHLELDDEFAFSMHDTREAWEESQREFAEMSAAIGARGLEGPSDGDEQEEFASTWSGVVSDEPIPCDSTGNIKLAFMLAEVVGELQRDGADKATIRRINEAFTEFRTTDFADSEQLAGAHHELIDALESIVDKHPRLTSRIADFQSRLQDRLRTRC